MAGTPTPNDDHGKSIEYDPDFKGPLKYRSCTDIICLLLFVVFLGCWIGVGIYAYKNGDPELVLLPTDSNGRRCGHDRQVINKPYLLFFDLTKCLGPNVPFTGCNTPQVCVEKCPKKEFHIDLVDTNQGMSLEDLICVNGVTRPTTLDQAKDFVDKKLCAKWYLRSEQVLKRCLYNVADLKLLKMDVAARSLNGVAVVRENLATSDTWPSWFVRSSIFVVGTDNDYVIEIVQDVVEDIKNSWKEILLGLGVGILLCILYILVLRWIAPVMVWLTILGTVAILSYCTYLCGINYKYYKDHPYDFEDATNPLHKFFMKANAWLGLLIVVAVILGILLLVLVFLRNRIVLAIALIKEAGKAVSAVTSTLVFPIAPWVLQMAIIAYTVGVALSLSSIGEQVYEVRGFNNKSLTCDNGAEHYKDGVSCTTDIFEKFCKTAGENGGECRRIGVDSPASVTIMHLFNIFGFFWVVFFISAMGEMILAATFATWYWTFHKSDVPFFTLTTATARTLRYHIGTLAFGSLIIAICRMIRVFLEYVDHKLKKYDNPVTKGILCCLKCFFWCLEKFLKFINKNAYIMCAIHGKNFCCSAKDAFSLLLRNIIRVFVLDKVVGFLFFLSKILVSIGVGCIVYSFLEYVSEKKMNYPIVPVIFVAVCTYLVATLFFSVYTMAVDTLFLCFLEDCERNDGSSSRPYYMSKNLMSILGKKNKTS